MQYMVASVTDADSILRHLDKDRAGVIWDQVWWTRNFSNRNVEFCCGDGTPKFNPFFIPKMISDIACGHISKYGFRGPNFATVSACCFFYKCNY
jgi:3-oxoacyl-[acyl-carrier-protein] synthase II